MKRLLFALFFALGVSATLPAQQASFLNFDRAARPADSKLSAPVPSADLPETPRAPQRGYGDDMGYRWDLAAGYEYVHFASTPFSADLSGIHTSVAYSVNNWFAAEGSVVAAFGGDVFTAGETAKYVLLTGGSRIFWNRAPGRFSPWAHALAGVARVNPQVAGSSKNGFALQTGGGVDWYFNPRLSFRGEADYVYSRLYSSSQNNVQAGVGFVLHF